MTEKAVFVVLCGGLIVFVYLFIILYAFAGSVWGALRGPCNRNISRICEVSFTAREPNRQLFG
jgi:hypothetical protein